MNDSEAQLDRLVAAAKRHDRPSEATTERAWASLEAEMIAGTGPSVPVDVGAGTAAGGVGLKSLVVVGVAIVTAATTVVIAGAIESRQRDPIVVVAPSEVEGATRAIESSPPPATLPALLPPVTSPTVASPPDTADRSVPTVGSASNETRAHDDAALEVGNGTHRDAATEVADSTLAEQARLLGDAWRDLGAGETARARAQLQEHTRRFPDSPLARERDAARIVVGCLEGEPWAAGQARRFVAEHGGGTVAARVERACGDEGSPASKKTPKKE